MEKQAPQFEDFFKLLFAMPNGQLVFLALFAATWLIGGNILVAFHYRRMGKHWASGFKPFAFPFKDFNAIEWAILVALAIVSLTFGKIALSYG